MFVSSSTIYLINPPAGELSQQSENQLAFLREILDRTCFARYQGDLSIPMEKDCKDSYWDCLQAYLGQENAPSSSDMDFLCYYLWAASLSGSEEKQNEISEVFSHLSLEEKHRFSSKLLSYPPILGAHIMRFADREMRCFITHKTCDDYYTILCWFNAASTHFSPEEKARFISNFSSIFSSDDLDRKSVV